MSSTPSPVLKRRGYDLLRLPLLGALLKHRYGRLVLQLLLVGFSLLLVVDGFWGTQRAPQNVATVASWVHYRGLVVLALLLVGNLFCMACPFTLPRTLAKRLSLRGGRFPKQLRNKWLSIIGLFTLFFAYEWLDLWSSPWLTAWVVVAYMVASFVLEAWFKESAFCKYVCPLGTFNFVYSTLSPTQIGVHRADVCGSCVGKECINGSYSPQPLILIDQIGQSVQHAPSGVLGCGTELFAPQIKTNLDCTLCLDCVRACPHDNIGLFTRSPLAELKDVTAWRKRWDVAFLVIILAFMGLTNAFGMVPPVYRMMQAMVDQLLWMRGLGISDRLIEALVLLSWLGLGSVVLPVALTFGAALLTRQSLRKPKPSLREVVATFAPAFVPIGFAIWFAHYMFHFLIGMWTIIPVLQQVLGLQPNWQLGGIPFDSPVLGLMELGSLGIGFVVSWWVAQQRAIAVYGKRQSFNAMLPWLMLFLGMLLVAIWLMGLPMEMRGTDFLFE